MKFDRPAMILFDVDGTLVDSVPDLAWCVDRMMEQLGLPARGEEKVRNWVGNGVELGLPARGEEKVRNWVGNGVEALVRRALVDRLEGEPDPELFQRAYPLFLELYAGNTSKRSYLYPGVKETLETLRLPRCERDTGNAARGRISAGQRHQQGGAVHLAPAGAARYPGVLPDRGERRYAATQETGSAAAGFRIVCMSYGYNHGEDIRDAGPDAVIDEMTRLPGLLP